jgi:hypothetical protein
MKDWIGHHTNTMNDATSGRPKESPRYIATLHTISSSTPSKQLSDSQKKKPASDIEDYRSSSISRIDNIIRRKKALQFGNGRSKENDGKVTPIVRVNIGARELNKDGPYKPKHLRKQTQDQRIPKRSTRLEDDKMKSMHESLAIEKENSNSPIEESTIVKRNKELETCVHILSLKTASLEKRLQELMRGNQYNPSHPQITDGDDRIIRMLIEENVQLKIKVHEQTTEIEKLKGELSKVKPNLNLIQSNQSSISFGTL